MNYQTLDMFVPFQTEVQNCRRTSSFVMRKATASLTRSNWLLPVCIIVAVTALIGTADIAALGMCAYQHYLTSASAALPLSLAPI